MSEGTTDRELIKNLHVLNARIEECPSRRMETITMFYGEHAEKDRNTADAVLILRSIMCGMEQEMSLHKTEHLKASKPLLMTGMIIMFVLSLAAIGAGFYAFHLNATGDTELSFLGLHLKSTSGGVIAIVVGLFFAYQPVRLVIKRTS